MNVLHVVNWGIWGGVQSVSLAIAREYSERKHHVLILNKGYKTDTLNLYTQYGVNCIEGKSIAEAVRETGADVCFLHNTRAGLLNDLPKCRYIRVWHGFGIGDWDGADGNWIVSDYVLGKINPPRDYFVLPPVITTSDFDVQRTVRKEPVIGKIQSTTYAGNPNPDDYYDLMKDYKTFVVGHGGRIDAPVRAGLTVDYMMAIDILAVYQDKGETWGLSLSEANLMGIPAIVRRNNDGMTEQAEKSGGAVLVDTKEEFAEVLKFLKEDTLFYDKIANAGREWCRNNMDASLLRKHL